MLFHVSDGSNGSCGTESESKWYLCHATKEGYNGPAGEGAPNGVFAATVAPVVTTGSAAGIKETEATLQGTVNPEGTETKYYFEYGTEKGKYTKTTAEASAGAGITTVEESKTITGLTGVTTYYYRIVATNSESERAYGAEQTFRTTARPTATTGWASEWTETEFVLYGDLDPNGLEAEYFFEYGPTTSYGSKSTPTKIDVALESDIERSSLITGLGAHTTYHYRMVAKNSDGATYGADHVFTKPTITEYSLPNNSRPRGISSGPSSTLWVADESSGLIDELTTEGAITEYESPKENWPTSITEGPDGNLWYTDRGTNEITKITPSGSSKQSYSLPVRSEPTGIAVGSDGNLWFTDRGSARIGKITTAGKITEYELPTGSAPQRIAAGPDGNLWFTEEEKSRIGKITTAGKITEYQLPEDSQPYGITAGPEKEAALWFTEDSGAGGIGRITTSGTITEYPSEADHAVGITAGSDGNLWFTAETGAVGKMTPAGVLTLYYAPSEGSPTAITSGPDGNLWFVQTSDSKVGKLVP